MAAAAKQPTSIADVKVRTVEIDDDAPHDYGRQGDTHAQRHTERRVEVDQGV
jgi:hypothetical protein